MHPPDNYFLIVYFQKRKGHAYLIIRVLDIEVPFRWIIIFLVSSVRFTIQLKSFLFGLII